jgi:hypothetical protein
VRITGLAMIKPMVLANAVGKPTLPRFRCCVSRSLIDMVRILESGFLDGCIEPFKEPAVKPSPASP